MKNVLLTGGAGFIGSHVAELLSKSYKLVVLDLLAYCASERNLKGVHNVEFVLGNIADEKLVSTVLTEHNIHIIMNFAAQTHVDNSFESSLEFTHTNVAGTHVLLACAQKYGKIERFVHVSTDEVYGSNNTDDHTVKYSELTSLLQPTNPYSASKAAAEMIVNAYKISYGLPVIITRCNNVYGPRQFPEKIVPRFILQAAQNVPLTLHGDGSSKRAYLYVTDAAEAFKVVLEHGVVGQVYNIGVEDEISNLTVARDILCATRRSTISDAEFSASTVFVPDRLFNDTRYPLKLERINNLGWPTSPLVDWKTGLRLTLDWYMANVVNAEAADKYWVAHVPSLRAGCKLITACRVCSNTELIDVLNLGTQPLANAFRHKNAASLPEIKYPLHLFACAACFHCQINCVVDPAMLFRHYIYVSGTTQTMRSFFSEFAARVHSSFPAAGKVLDIACNDGSQLTAFKALGWETYGVDPATNLLEASTAAGHAVTCDFWSMRVAKSLPCRMDVIVAQNVFAHVDDVHGFLKACKCVLAPGGSVYIQTSQARMIKERQLDTIYHEHLSFFSTKSMKTLLELNEMHLVEVFMSDVHGGSYVFVAKDGGAAAAPEADSVCDMLAVETLAQLYNVDEFALYAKDCKRHVAALAERIDAYRANGARVVGFGAAAKANTLINYMRMPLEFVIDENPRKVGMLLPGQDIPVVSVADFVAMLNEDAASPWVIIPLAWNFFEEIRTKVQQMVSGETHLNATLLKYYPQIEEVRVQV